MTSLTKTASWVIVEKSTNKVIVEIFSKQTAEIIQRNQSSQYKAIPILQYLQDYSSGIK
jgi:hypothetical protein